MSETLKITATPYKWVNAEDIPRRTPAEKAKYEIQTKISEGKSNGR